MKKLFSSALIALTLSLSLSTNSASANDEIIGLSDTFGVHILWPVVALKCLAEGDFSSSGCAVAYAVGVPIGISTTTFLLKEAQAAKPDALAYVAGEAPSPLLEAVVGDLQDFSYELNGEELSFDEIVDDILSNI